MPIEWLEDRRRTVGSYFFSALYQQRPTPPEGGIFKPSWFEIVPQLPAQAKRAVRGWDKAGTQGGGDYSAGVLISEYDGTYYVVDVKRGQWSNKARNDIMLQTAELDHIQFGRQLAIWCEQEPGSSGKESAEFTVRLLVGFDVHAEPSTGDKETRARAFAAQCEAGNVKLIRGAWNSTYLHELCLFPHGRYDDQVDATSLAFNKLARPKREWHFA